jgi:hypothetical protein
MTDQKIHFIVVDNAGPEGYVFAHDREGKAFTYDTADEFAVTRNAELKTPTYAVYVVEPLNIHKARRGIAPYGVVHCAVCGQPIKRVPGGHGPVWVHSETGAVVGSGAG